MKATTSPVPRHVGIIMDGNRRFAKQLMLKPWQGHEWGAKKLKDVLTWSHEAGIKEVTFYAFSIENFNRPKEEFEYLMNLFLKEFRELHEPANLAKMAKEGVRINFLGRISLFPQPVQDAMRALMVATRLNAPHTVNFAMAYGGRAEIIDATKKVAQLVKDGKLDVENIDESIFQKQLYTESEPDLIIRTSGEQRISGFMLWQGHYAELFFCPKKWPEFEKTDFLEAIASYQDRDRRLGK
jgi:tritrans,polycis-undecaprenyl-diphosphate synthase [geranylgeranyl-diphosphate specific]